MRNFRLIKIDFVRYRWSILAGLLALLLVDGLQLVIPRIIKNAVDDLTTGTASATSLMRYAAYIAVAAVLIGLLRLIWRYFILSTSHRIERNLRNRIFAHLLTLAPRFFERTKTGDLMAHASNDTNAVRMAVGMGMVALMDIFALGIASLIFMVLISPKMTLMAFIPMPLVALVTLRFSSLVHHRFEQVQETFSRLTESVREAFSAIKTIKAYVQEKASNRAVENVSRLYMDKNMNLVRVWGTFFPLILFFSNFSLAVVLYLGGTQAILQRITPGDFVAFTGYLALLTWPMMALGWVVNLLKRGSASLGRIGRILDERPEISDGPSILPVEYLEGEIELVDLSFSYGNGEQVLKALNIRILPGQTIALVGRTGSGKTTLCNLLLRLYDPCLDMVFLDRMEIHRIPLGVLRSSFGYVPQDTFLFSDTVRENILFGRLGVSEKALYRATQVARIYDEILALPSGFETLVGEKGAILSGGQRQRLAIARAILLEPTILILDDALSSVDTETEREITVGLREIRKNRVNIIVSHRLASIQGADQIFFLNEGELLEKGTHRELMALGGAYATLYLHQQLEEELQREDLW